MPIELNETQRRAEELAEAVDDLHAAIAQKGMLQGQHTDVAYWVTMLRVDMARLWGDDAYGNCLRTLAEDLRDPARPHPEPRPDWKPYLANVCGSVMRDELYGADQAADSIYQVWVDPACPSPASAVSDAMLLHLPIRFANIMHCDVFDPATNTFIDEVDDTTAGSLTGMAAVGRTLTPYQEHVLFSETPTFVHDLRERVNTRWLDNSRNLFSRDRQSPHFQGGPAESDVIELAKQVEWTAGTLYFNLQHTGFLQTADQQIHYRMLQVRREAAKLAGHPEAARTWGQHIERMATAQDRTEPADVWKEHLLVVTGDDAHAAPGIYRVWVNPDSSQPADSARRAFLFQNPVPFPSALHFDLIDPLTGKAVIDHQPNTACEAPMAHVDNWVGPANELDTMLHRKPSRPRATADSDAPAP